MNLKTKVAVIIVFITVLVTYYYIQKIDYYEQALLGHVYINKPSSEELKKYAEHKKEYKELVQNYKQYNPAVFARVAEMRENNKRPSTDTSGDEVFNPTDLNIDPISMWYFKVKHPSEYKLYHAIKADLIYRYPHPPSYSNPPKPVIEHAVKKIYRYMFLIDGTLILGLLVFLFAYKGRETSENQKA